MSDEPVKKLKQKLSDDNVVPIAAGNPAKAESLAIDQSQLDEYFGDGGAESSVAGYGRPPKGVFFTVMPEPTPQWQNRGFYWILEIPNRDPYFVTPAIAKVKAGEDVLRPLLLVRYVTMAGDEGLWPIKLNPPDGRANLYNSSARNIMEVAANGTPATKDKPVRPGPLWVRLVSANGYYEHIVSPITMEESPPQFTNRTFAELVAAVSEGRIVDTLDHEVWSVLSHGR
jgi:hypothetical protein